MKFALIAMPLITLLVVFVARLLAEVHTFALLVAH